MGVITAVVALIATAIFLVWYAAPSPAREAMVVRQHTPPFYLERALYEKGPADNLVIFMREVLARRSDGTTAHIEYLQLPKLPPIRRVNLIDGSAVWLIDSLKSKTSWPKPSNLRGESHIPVRECGLPTGNIGLVGHDSVSGRNTIVGLADLGTGRQMKFWLAPGLGCEMLRFEHTSGTTMISESHCIQLINSEPDSKLFDLGNTYAEIVPSELKTRQFRAIGASIDDNERRIWERLDQEYRFAGKPI